MKNKFRPIKLLPIWIAVSSVIILAGVLLMGLLGFNTSAARPQAKTFEVEYNIVVEISKEHGPEELAEICEKAFKAHGISYLDKTTDESSMTVGDSTLRYTFKANTSDEALGKAKADVEAAALGDAYKDATIYVSVHTLDSASFHKAIWRGAVAIICGAVVALIYVGVRFGVGSALTGLTLCAHDVFLTLGLLAITRIPVTVTAYLVYGAIAAFVSLVLWLVQCAKMRENFKNPSYAALDACEAVEASTKTSRKLVIITAAAIAAILLVLGAVAVAGVRGFTLPALLSVGAGLYSSLLFGPALHVHVKAAFDKLKAKTKKYQGKKKAEKDVVKAEND